MEAEQNTTVRVLRYCSAKTVRALLREIADPDSRDHGIGHVFPGLVVGIDESDSYRIERPANVPGEYSDDSVYTPDTLRAHIHTQGAGRGRVMWAFDVDRRDIIGPADRRYGMFNEHCDVDGIVIRPGARVSNIRRV